MRISKNKIKDVVNHWRTKMPMMAMEECGELIQAISKYERKGDENTLRNLKEEIRDMYITLECLLYWYDIDEEEIKRLIDHKLDVKKDD